MEDIIELEYKKPEYNPHVRQWRYAVVNRLYEAYINNISAYIAKKKIKDPYTGQDYKPDEHFMRSIEEKVDVSEQGADDFRRSIMTNIGMKSHCKESVQWDDNAILAVALLQKLIGDSHYQISWSELKKMSSEGGEKQK